MRISFALIFILLFFTACKSDEEPIVSEPTNNAHLQYFGFTIIDTYWDDPTDSNTKTNYADEIQSFSNLADMLVVTPDDNLVQRVQQFSNLDLKAVFHFNELFFELVDANSPSGANYNLRADYEQRWNQFKNLNESILDTTYMAAFYIGEEPTWNGISFNELNTVAELLKEDKPEIPLLIIEAYPSLTDLRVPEAVDWIGFDRYFIKNPVTDSDFQQNWKTLKSKMSNPDQRIMIIMDTHYIDWAHGDYGNIALDQMDDVADNYYTLAKADEQVIGILGYFWPNGFDIEGSIGARGMPQSVKTKYEQIGEEITGKN